MEEGMENAEGEPPDQYQRLGEIKREIEFQTPVDIRKIPLETFIKLRGDRRLNDARRCFTEELNKVLDFLGNGCNGVINLAAFKKQAGHNKQYIKELGSKKQTRRYLANVRRIGLGGCRIIFWCSCSLAAFTLASK